MPVRPFYIEGRCDGRETSITGGPKRKDGEMKLSLHQRDEGEITTPYTISQFSEMIEGVHHLKTVIYYRGAAIHSHVTKY